MECAGVGQAVPPWPGGSCEAGSEWEAESTSLALQRLALAQISS